jgi:hypothetical protein
MVKSVCIVGDEGKFADFIQSPPVPRQMPIKVPTRSITSFSCWGFETADPREETTYVACGSLGVPKHWVQTRESWAVKKYKPSGTTHFIRTRTRVKEQRDLSLPKKKGADSRPISSIFPNFDSSFELKGVDYLNH